jgi:hypothetical protein
MADYSLFQEFLNKRTKIPGGLNSPAFEMNRSGKWNLTPITQDVLSTIRSAPGARLFNISPMPAPAARDGVGLWGTGSGYHSPDTNQTYIDPLIGSTLTAAHEAGHAAFPSLLAQQRDAGKLNFTVNPATLNRDSGQEMVYASQFARPTLIEEANAQGIAYGAIDRINPSLRADEYVGGWSRGPLQYPGEYNLGGMFDPIMTQYAQNKMGPPSPEKMNVLYKSRENSIPMMQRQFNKAYNLINP